MTKENNVNEDNVIITVIGEQQSNSEPGFNVKFHNETVGMAILLDLGAYFTGLVRGQSIRTRPPEDQGSEPEQNEHNQKKERVKKPAVKR